MNETFAKVLQFCIIFWLVFSFLAITFEHRINSYIVDDTAFDEIRDAKTLGILWHIMTFRVTAVVPIFIGMMLDILSLLTFLSILMVVFDR